jgi:hypothetical protein
MIMGVDPSRLRDCRDVAIRQGKNIVQVVGIAPMGDAYELAQLISRMGEDVRPCVVNVDSGNPGRACIDILQRLTGYMIMGLEFGAAVKNDRKPFNRRAEMYDELRQWLSAGGKLPHSTKLANELMAIELNDRREGRLMLQSKHKLAKTSHLADAWAFTRCRELGSCPCRARGF